jgi:hypothetical protein
MDYLALNSSFFEDNRQFFEDIVTNSEHGAWSTRKLCDDFACLVTTRHPPAFVHNGELVWCADEPYLIDLEFWSLSRDFPLNGNFDCEEVDIFVNADCDSEGKWQLSGSVRREFIIDEASAELEQVLLNAVSKFGDPALWVGKARI